MLRTWQGVVKDCSVLWRLLTTSASELIGNSALLDGACYCVFIIKLLLLLYISFLSGFYITRSVSVYVIVFAAFIGK